jgi:hypothetical protein
MARIRVGTTGTPSGKVGNTVYKYKNKKTIAYQLNEAYNKSNSEAALKNEEIFTKITKFCNFVNRPAIVKTVWKFAKMPGHYTNLMIFKYNHNSIKSWGISSDFKILPDNFFYKNKNIILDKDKLTLEFSVTRPLQYLKRQDEFFEPPYTFIALIHAEDPVIPDSKPNKVNLFLTEKPTECEIDDNSIFTFTFDTEKDSFSFIDNYKTVIVFPAVVSINQPALIYKWAQNGGFYIKGSKLETPIPKPAPPPEAPNKSFIIEYD